MKFSEFVPPPLRPHRSRTILLGGGGGFLICLIHRFSTCGLPFHSRLVVNYSLERFPFIFNWQSLIFNKAHFFFFNFNFSKYLFVTHGERQVIWKRKELEISWSIEKKIDQFEEHRKEFLIKKKKNSISFWHLRVEQFENTR